MKDTVADQERLVRQLAALRVELGETSTQYEQSLAHLASIQVERDALAQRCSELEAIRVQLEEEAQVLRRASVRAALLMEQVEVREQQYRTDAEAWATSSKDLAAEMRAAGLAQRFLIPEVPPTDVPGLELATSYRPASQTSGDWFGFLRSESSDELSILIGDATGHGLAAALMTAAVFASIETLKVMGTVARDGLASGDDEGAAEAGSLASILERIRSPRYLLAMLEEVVGAAGGSLYPMTFLAAVYSPGERTLRYANAGHCFPLLVSQRASSTGDRTSQVHALRTSSSPLGLGATTAAGSREEQLVSLAPGDLVLLYSDGLTEACNSRGRSLTTRRVAEWMMELRDEPIAAVRDGLCARFDRFVHGAAVADDVTFVVARVT